MTRLAPAVTLLAACALTSKAPPRDVRYFAPELDPVVAQPAAAAPCARVRLGRIDAAAELRLPIEHRLSAVELEPYETLRWTEPPDAYATRTVTTALFARRPLEQAVSGVVPVLDVTVTAFEEVGDGSARAARVELRYELRDDRIVLARGTVRIERTTATPAIDRVVAAMGAALVAASDQLADRVVAAACRTP